MIHSRIRTFVRCGAILAAAVCLPGADFQRDVRPVLAKRCFACHGPDDHSRQAKLRLDTREGATGQNGGYPGIVPGHAERSRVMARITAPKQPMPPNGERLSRAEVELIRNWINEGAEYKQHWSFEAPRRPRVPEIANRSWAKNEVDNFIAARLEREGLKPSPEADRYTLARRVALDLTGLPPAPELVAEFVHDRGDKAYERLVDRMLASPHYGERWARVWLDLARYADTQGYEKDQRRNIWQYRDWVVRAFNSNMPFSRFTILQIAGDLLPNAGPEERIATGFHRNTMTNAEGGTDDEEFRDAAVKDRVAVTGQVWMGLTWGCAQCHTHKYDPLSHQEFYQLYAFFNQSEDSDKEDDRPALDLPEGSTLIMRELEGASRRVTHLQERGNFLNPSTVVEPGVPHAFPPLPAGAPRNRLGLAMWLVDPANALTARVQVNRFWARLFGRGIVETEEDFGTQGSQPAHPELLDWLATEFMRTNWDMKALLKTIVMSAAYRQSSTVTPALYTRDPYNTLITRGGSYRLDAEQVRDQALAAAGLLSAKMGGPPVMPWQPPGVWSVVYNADRWNTSAGEDRYRRGLYTFMRRTSPYPAMVTYDAPPGDVCTLRRIRTNTPLQALESLNDPVSMEAAQSLALRSAGSGVALARAMLQRVLVRPPSGEEVDRMMQLHRQAAENLRKSPGAAQKLLHFGERLYRDSGQVTLVADSRKEPQAWRITAKEPAESWIEARFDDSAWSSAPAPFGYLGDPAGYFARRLKDSRPTTLWKDDQLWLRRTFEMPSGKLEDVRLLMRCLCAFEVYLNGVQAASTNVDRKDYYEYAISPEGIAALHPGRNTMAVHITRIHELQTGQLFDGGMIASREPDLPPARPGDEDRAAWVVVANALLNLDEVLTRR